MTATPQKPNRIADNNFLFAGNHESAIVAHSGGGQTNAYQLQAQRNNVATVAVAADSVKLPKIVSTPNRLDAGGVSQYALMFVFNSGANALQLYGSTADTVNAAATATGISIPAGSGAICVAGALNGSNVGNWQAFVTQSAAAGMFTNVTAANVIGSSTNGELQINGNSGTMLVNVPLTATDISRRVFIAERACIVKAVSSAFSTASSSGTLNVEKTPSGTAPGSGTAMLTGTIALSGTANTPAAGTLSGTVANLILAVGDSVSIVIAGTMTNLVGGVATIEMAPL